MSEFLLAAEVTLGLLCITGMLIEDDFSVRMVCLMGVAASFFGAWGILV